MDAAFILNQSVDASGFITKRGKIVKSWKRRFFTLRGTEFSYFSDESRYHQLGGGSCERIMPWAGRKYGLILTCESGRRFRLSCDSQEDCDFWMRAFTRAIMAYKDFSRMFVSLKVDALERTERESARISMRESMNINRESMRASMRLTQLPCEEHGFVLNEGEEGGLAHDHLMDQLLLGEAQMPDAAEGDLGDEADFGPCLGKAML